MAEDTLGQNRLHAIAILRRCSFWFSFIFSIVSIISMVALNRPFAIFTQLNFNPFLQFKLTLE